jgi:hypothetical protein
VHGVVVPAEQPFSKLTVTMAVPGATPRTAAVSVAPVAALESTATSVGSEDVAPPIHPPGTPLNSTAWVKATDRTAPTRMQAMVDPIETSIGDGVGWQLAGCDFGPTAGTLVVVTTGAVADGEPDGTVDGSPDDGTDGAGEFREGVSTVAPGVVPLARVPPPAALVWRAPPPECARSATDVISATATAAAATSAVAGTNRAHRP